MTYTKETPVGSEWLSINNTANTLSGTPPQIATTITFLLTAHDPKLGSIDISVSITTNLNQDPVCPSSLPDLYCYEGVECTEVFSTDFVDPDGDTITYGDTAIIPSLSTFVLDATQGSFKTTPSYSEIQNETAYILTIVTQDQFFPDTAKVP